MNKWHIGVTNSAGDVDLPISGRCVSLILQVRSKRLEALPWQKPTGEYAARVFNRRGKPAARRLVRVRVLATP